jgi:hypothetical protein
MPHPRLAAVSAALALLATAGCASAPPAAALAPGSQARVEGTVAAIDTQPWAYDGNAVVALDTAAHGRVSVQLPARWNLCKAAPVDVAALAVGARARAVGTVTADGSVVVCEGAGDALVRID